MALSRQPKIIPMKPSAQDDALQQKCVCIISSCVGEGIQSKGGCGQGLTRNRFMTACSACLQTGEQSYDLDSTRRDPTRVRRSTARHSEELFRSLPFRTVFTFRRGNCCRCRTELEWAGSGGVTSPPRIFALHRYDVYLHEEREPKPPLARSPPNT